MNLIDEFKNNSIVIDYDNKDRRIDNFMFSNFRNISKSLIYKHIRIGNIKVNIKKITPKYKLKINDIIKFPNYYLDTSKKKKINLKKEEYINFFKKIIYEDDYLLIINKPYGISVHGGNNNKNIISILKCIKNNEKNLNLVHRLDKETSGILIISKKISILRNLHKQFNNNLIERKYIALVNGLWNLNNKNINISISKIKNNKGKNISILNNNGKKCSSIFKINKIFSEFTLMDIKIITGRFHQIRIHAKYCGNPIVCDKIYGFKKDNIKVNNLGLKRLFLHANYIKFFHPIYNKKICLLSNLDKELENFIKKIN
ncbi:RluA family pseudouridine synthase [endosymbiont of Pachyrhynchus infernalis]|uniref:RluA family pseudouridine synthase n=1 Tax=endosymbiont of Pachyrhynchus infernalis TaxID=1971488 RepID=UPI000DC7152E|nr:RluA family pseudouridine synthase [endosymbiont of Pachyrhynchus infernalis]BBA84888.1 pseudouridine synthase [endosymbiont of Pachyrhynchus infernalis]